MSTPTKIILDLFSHDDFLIMKKIEFGIFEETGGLQHQNQVDWFTNRYNAVYYLAGTGCVFLTFPDVETATEFKLTWF